MRYIDLASDDWDTIFRHQWPAEVLLRTTQLYRALKQARDIWIDARTEIIKRYADLDETGNIKVSDNGEISVPEVKKQQLLKELSHLDFAEVEAPKITIPARYIPDGLTPVELAKIVDYIED